MLGDPARLLVLAHRQPDVARAGRAHGRDRGRRGRRTSSPAAWPRIHAAFASLLGRRPRRRRAGRSTAASSTCIAKRAGRASAWRSTFVDATDPDAVEAAFRPNTRLLHLETIANPTIVVADLAALIERGPSARHHGQSSTTRSPRRTCAGRSELGADLVIESLTKWIGGHSDVLAASSPAARTLIGAVREMQIDTGGALAPFSAFLVLRGIETLHVRMERHAANALALARHLEASRTSAPVCYPGLPSIRRRAWRSASCAPAAGCWPSTLGDRRRRGGVPRRADAAAAHRVAGERPHDRGPSAVDHPSPAGRGGARGRGHSRGLVRVSVGLEDIDDLLADFDQALAAARHAKATLTRRHGVTGSLGDHHPRRPPGRRAARPVRPPGLAAWQTLTSVRFAVAPDQRPGRRRGDRCRPKQVPAFALHDPSAYADADGPDPRRVRPDHDLGLNVGPAMVDLFERLGFFRVFSAPWFVFLLTLLVVSIICARSIGRPTCGAPPAVTRRPGRRRSSTCAWTTGRCVANVDEAGARRLETVLRGRASSVREQRSRRRRGTT